MQYLQRRGVRWVVLRAIIASVITVVAYPVHGEPGQLDWWEAARVLVTGSTFIVASRLWLMLVPVERGSDDWMDAPVRRQTSPVVLRWAQARYGDVGGLTELRRHRRGFRSARHERVFWRTTAWLPTERGDEHGWHLRDVELRFDADGTPHLIDVHYSTPERELPPVGDVA